MTVYPLPPRAHDERFDDGLVNEVAVVLELRGFPPVRTGSDKARLREHLSAFLYSGAAEGVAAPARPAPQSTVERGSGTPDDWFDYAVDHPAPSGHLVFPEPHSDPAVGFGIADYRSPKRLAWL